MTRSSLVAALAAALCALAFSASAQANTTIPGNNGKIAYTTDAFTGVDGIGPVLVSKPTTRGDGVKCATFAFPTGGFSAFEVFGISLPFNVLDCTAEIATINPDGTGFNQVTNNTVQDDYPAWLPQDGSKLAYQSLQNEDGCNESDQPRGTIQSLCLWNIWSTAPNGTGNTQLTGLTNDVVQSEHPSYSPDGSKIAFEAFNPIFFKDQALKRDLTVFAGPEDLTHLGQIIYTMPAGGTTAGTPTPLVPSNETGVNGKTFVSDSQPSWSPDGSKIAFTRFKITDVTETPASPRIQALRTFTLNSTTYVAPATGGSSTQIESTPDCTVELPAAGVTITAATRQIKEERCLWDMSPTWSPDGSKIAVTQESFPTFFLEPFALAAASKGLTVIEPGIEDSDIVVFNSSDGSGEVNLSKVTEPADCQTNLDSGSICSLDQKPAWSPDGSKIAFFSNRDSTGQWPIQACEGKGGDASLCDDEIWTMNADGSSPFQVTNNDVNDINPDWQRIPPPSTPPATPAAPTTPPKVGVAGVRRACVSSGFHVRFRVTTSSAVKSVVVKLDGKKIKSTTSGSFTLRINGKKLKSGRHRLTITATDSAGRVTTTHKSFSVCKAAKPRRKAAPRFTG
jgi:Tol biopolymer transport system component